MPDINLSTNDDGQTWTVEPNSQSVQGGQSVTFVNMSDEYSCQLDLSPFHSITVNPGQQWEQPTISPSSSEQFSYFAGAPQMKGSKTKQVGTGIGGGPIIIVDPPNTSPKPTQKNTQRSNSSLQQQAELVEMGSKLR